MTLTQNLVSVIRSGVGRKKRWSEDMQARFPEGTFARIVAMLIGKEDRTDFVREAVERELKRREGGSVGRKRAGEPTGESKLPGDPETPSHRKKPRQRPSASRQKR